MNNLRLLTGLLAVTLLSGGVRSYGQSVITLEEIFKTAEANSAQLRPSFSAQDEAERAAAVARSGRLPDINASLSVSYIGDGFTTKRDFSDYQRAPIPHLGTGVSVNVTQPVYTGGAMTRAIELAELKTTAARYAADFQRDNIRFSLAGFYLDIYKYTNLRHVVEGNITAARKVLEEIRARHEQGTVLQNDITRYELLLSNLELQLVRINNTLEILNSNLVTTAGLPDGTVIVPDSSILSRSLPAENAYWWQQEATVNSPSLSLARSGVDMSRKAEDLVRAERRPKVGLQAAWTMDGPILVEIPPIDRNLSYWYVGVGISYNISSLYKSSKSLAKSRAATKKAVEELAAAEENVSLSVKADHVRYLEAYEELKTRIKGAELAERNYRTIETRYSADMALITDMLDAANAKLDAEQQLVNARINIIYYYYKLLFTTGKI
ncbi:MAG: TolC family protein [Bacteroidales bacterium]|nr:TolC family protein [Bacteroidales bacterium]MCM1147804.1 TolC family protein [Bacteroidales bacterium]MCM1206452.1 TolC family protein [Bacillota bacterium]MCM1510337.1 TolC family protein [Clostridium sp.]